MVCATVTLEGFYSVTIVVLPLSSRLKPIYWKIFMPSQVWDCRQILLLTLT